MVHIKKKKILKAKKNWELLSLAELCDLLKLCYCAVYSSSLYCLLPAHGQANLETWSNLGI